MTEEESPARGIERAVSRALAKAGQGGDVVVRENMCELHSSGEGSGVPVVAIDLGDWVAQWNLLPDDINEDRANKAATRLTNALNLAQGRAAPIPKAELQRRLRRVALVVAVVGLIGTVGLWLYRKNFLGGGGGANTDTSAVTTTSGSPQEDEAARKARIRKVCDAARQRMYQGGALGMDIEGWVVELWLARDTEGLVEDSHLMATIEKGLTGELGAKGPSEITVIVDENELNLPSAVVRFSGGYVPPFFEPKGRERFMAVVEQIADGVGAMHAALYSRCEHLPTARDVGAWYRGIDLNGAVVSLLFASGRYANPPAFDVKKYDAPLATLRVGVAKLDTTKRDEILRRQGGRPHTHEPPSGKKAVSLRYPLGGPTRAGKSSRDLAKLLGL